MAFIRKRANGQLSLVFWWQGKSWIKALGTTDEKEAEQTKKDAEAQLNRIRQGKSPLAARLLADGIPITDVLFGSPEVALRISKEDGNESPLPLGELIKAYLAGLPGSVSPEHRYTIELWLKHVREFLGDDRPIMSLTTADLEAYRKKRVGPGGENTVSLKKELTYLKSVSYTHLRAHETA
ncbi:MAG: hypothetical protein QUV05_03945, partial [Phycisphaerae bacterium]|nr:hypothetical protein [Phycisphaerae bacterium]